MRTRRWIASILLAMMLVMAGVPCMVNVITAVAEEAVAAAPSEGTVLEVGSKGEDVVWLQNALNQGGGAALVVDGNYGNATAAAVSAFQEQHGLPVTGTADAATIAALTATLDASDAASDADGQEDPNEPLADRKMREAMTHFEFDSAHIYRSYWKNYFDIAKWSLEEGKEEVGAQEHPVLYVLQLVAMAALAYSMPVSLAGVAFLVFYLIGWLLAHSPFMVRHKLLHPDSKLHDRVQNTFGSFGWMAVFYFAVFGPLLLTGLYDGAFLYAFYTHEIKACVIWAILVALTRIAACIVLYLLIWLVGVAISKLFHLKDGKTFRALADNKPLKTVAGLLAIVTLLCLNFVPNIMYFFAALKDSSVSF